MRWLVTGAAGFIGSHVVDELISRGFDVIGVDNLVFGSRSNVNPKSDFRVADIRDLDTIISLSRGVDYFIHCAALLPAIRPPLEDPVEHQAVNVVGTLNCLRAAAEAGSAKFVFASTCAVYGQADVFPTPEGAAPRLQTRPYSIQKYSAEQHTLLMGARYDIPVVALRYFATYGPRSFNQEKPSNSYSPVIGIFLNQAKEGKPLTVTGDGSQSRDFVNVKDVSRITIETALSEANQEIYNVSSGTSVSILDLARMISDDIVFVPRHVGEVDKVWGDNSKLHHQLGLRPEISLEDGIRQFAN